MSAGHSAKTKARTAVYLRADTGRVPPDSPYVPAITSGLPYPVNVFPEACSFATATGSSARSEPVAALTPRTTWRSPRPRWQALAND